MSSNNCMFTWLQALQIKEQICSTTYVVSNHFVPEVKQVKSYVCPYPVKNTIDSKGLHQIWILINAIFFFLKHVYWSIIALQWGVSFCCITKWISYTYTYIPISPPSCASLPPSLSHPSRWSQSTELISLCYATASH